jgi:ABC-type dipeptide/oligopeptide/nickel transport system ATPase component
VVEEGATDAVLDHPAHEYTQRLVASMPRAGGDWLS